MRKLSLLLLSLAVLPVTSLSAQSNYEIQVYPSETADKNTTFFELHSNFTGSGTTGPCTFSVAVPCVYPTNHQEHETLEITHGFSKIFEVGMYFFTSAGPGQGWQYVGSHIRPRIRAPEEWNLPVGLSLSTASSGCSRAPICCRRCRRRRYRCRTPAWQAAAGRAVAR